MKALHDPKSALEPFRRDSIMMARRKKTDMCVYEMHIHVIAPKLAIKFENQPKADWQQRQR